MLNALSMTKKLMATLVPGIVIVFLVITLLLQAEVTKTSTHQAMHAAHLLAQNEGKKAVASLNSALQELKGLTATAKTRTQIPAEQRRDYFNNILKQHLMDRPDIIGSWTLWEPNAFDGLDNRHQNSDNHDASGRFIPYWYRDAQGKITVEPLVSYTQSGAGDYYQLSKASRKPTILDPYWYEIAGQQRLITSVVVPIIEQGQFKGVVGVDVLVDEIQGIVSKLKLYDTGAAAIFTNNAVVIAHPDAKRLGKNAADTEADISGNALPSLLEAIRTGNPFNVIADTPLFNGGTLILSEKIELAETTSHWNFVMALPMEKVSAEANKLVRHIIMISLLALVLLVIIIVAVSKSIANPLNTLSNALNDIANGDGDLTRRLEVKGNDEVASLSKAFNTFSERIRVLVFDIAERSELMASVSTQLEKHSQDARTGAESQRQEVDSVASSMNEMNSAVMEVAHNAQQASDSAQNGNNQVADGLNVVGSVVESIQQQALDIQSAADAISELEAGSQEIGAVIHVIREIADQTNLSHPCQSYPQLNSRD